MSVLSLGQIFGGNQKNLYKIGERVRNAVSEISAAAEKNITGATGVDAASVSAQKLQARVNGFREAAQDLAKNVTELSVAARGSEDIAEQLSELERLTQQALERPDTPESRERVNEAVKRIRFAIDVAAKQSFGEVQPQGQNTSQESQSTKQQLLQQFKLDSQSLLGAKTEITDAGDLRNLLATVQNAAGKVAAAQDEIKSLFDDFETMAVHLEVSMENQVAANSYLPVEEDEVSALALLFADPNKAAVAQAGNLPTELLNLI